MVRIWCFHCCMAKRNRKNKQPPLPHQNHKTQNRLDLSVKGGAFHVCVKVTQSCLTLCDYIAHGILQARILEWVAFPFSRGSSQPRDQTQVSHIVGGFFNLSHQGSPRILECVAYPFSRGSSQPRDQTGVSCIASRFFTS